jgi:ABC-2 type transport system ATP-binding protein
MNPSANNGSAVIVQDVRKVFVDERQQTVVAVDGLSFEIRRGEIFSLVGPDGAGKTTTIRMMCGVSQPTEGIIRILGKDMRIEREAIKRFIGYLSQRFSLYGDLTIDENIDFFAEIHRLQDFQSRKEELLDFMRLTPFRGRLAERLSGGMKQKLALACTLIHTPQLIFLDEPTTGVDPVSRREFWKILSAVLKSGVTIVMATPYLDEAERSTRVAFIHEGRLLMCDTPERVKASFKSYVLELICSDPRTALAILKQSKDVEGAELFGDRLHVVLSKRSFQSITRSLEAEKIDVLSTRFVPPTLEDVFISNIR